MKVFEEKEELNLITLAQEYSDEDKARGLLESILWPHGPTCPHCKNHKEKQIYRLQPKPTSKSPGRKGVCKCGACRKQFTVTVGTIFEDSHLPISKWLMAIFIICSSKKSISANQLSRMLKITYKAAWFMAHRLRFAVSVYGSWHHVSREHLPKYANEFAFRWNTRFLTDGERMESAIGMVTGKRLTYRQAV